MAAKQNIPSIQTNRLLGEKGDKDVSMKKILFVFRVQRLKYSQNFKKWSEVNALPCETRYFTCAVWGTALGHAQLVT